MTRRLLLSLVLTIPLCGCGTLFDMLGDEKKHSDQGGMRSRSRSLSGGELRIYGGLRWDLEILAEADAGWLLALVAVDVPLSAVVDTLFLPLTVTYNLVK